MVWLILTLSMNDKKLGAAMAVNTPNTATIIKVSMRVKPL
jgi:hypothetical protein